MPENTLIATLRESRDVKQADLDALLKTPTEEKRNLSTEESTSFDTLGDEIRGLDDRIKELEELDKRAADAAEARKAAGDTGEQRAKVTDAPVYSRHNPATSYFRDLWNARNGDRDAAERLRRNNEMRADAVARMPEAEREARALSTTAGAGGEFAPPLWLIEDFVALARPGRKFADSLNPAPLPEGVSSINLPKVSGGTSTAVQTTQNSALSQTDMTTTSVTSGITTIGGKQVVSRQLLDQSGIPFDQVILGDLARDYAKQFDNQAINGSNASGQLNGVYTYFNASGTVNVTYTQATPAVGGAGGFYAKIFSAAANIEAARFVPPDTIWMHPRRWNWVLSASDSSNRPLVVPSGAAYNPVGSKGANAAEGMVGQIGGLDVVTDANIVTNLGAGTNQDPVLVGIRSDLRLWESALRAETFDATYADSAGVLFRVMAYSAAIPNRYASSVSVINGTGTIAPTF